VNSATNPPPPPQSRPFPKNPPHFFHTLHPRARLRPLPLPDGSRTFRARREGMPPDLVRKRQRGGQGEAMANAVPLAGGALSRNAVQSQPPGRGPVPACLKWRAGAGHRCGPVADMAPETAARVRAGTRAQSISRGPSRPRPGQPGWRALKRGRWISQPSRACEAAPVGWGQHPANSGPRAVSATQYQSYLRHCLRAALRTEFRADPGGHVARAVSGCPQSQAGAEKGPVSPRAAAHCRRAINFVLPGEHSRSG
jgi:hypothetical protein